MAAYNPCYCWNLRDGCITVGIWSLIWAMIQLGLFCWQTWIINWKRSIFENRRSPVITSNNAYENQAGNVDWTQFYQTPEEYLYFRIFIIQILNLIAAFFLLFASAALVYGIYTNSKHMVWPWFPCMVCSILCSAAYCIMWWAGNVTSYWLVLTIVEFLAILVNLYCLLCVIVQYRRIITGYVQHDDDYKPTQIVYDYRPKVDRNGTEEKKKVGGGYHNAVYEPDVNLHKVNVYKGDNLLDDDENKQKLQSQETQTTLPQYQPFQVQYYPVPMAQELPVKATPAQQSPEPEFKTRFTEAWIKGVNNVPPEEPPRQQLISAHASPERHFKRTKSVDALQDRHSRRKKRHRHNHLKHSKSKDSIASTHQHHRHRHHHRRSDTIDDSTSSETDYDDKKGKNRCPKCNDSDYDSGTEYSASVTAYSEDQNSKIYSERPRRKKSSDNKKHRDKRRDKKISDDDAQKLEYDAAPPGQSRAPPVGGVQVLPTFGSGVPGGITIPQHIVIPPNSRDANQPQRYQINSEITIRYNKDGSVIGEPINMGKHRPTIQPVSTSPSVPITAPSPPTTASTAPMGVGGPATRGVRTGGHLDSSTSDVKGYVSTAV